MINYGKKYNELTRKLFEAHGFIVHKVEKHNSFSGKKNDLFGIIDYLGLKEGLLVAIQSTSKNGKSEHIKTIKERPETKLWLSTNSPFYLICWTFDRQKTRNKYQYELLKVVQSSSGIALLASDL